MFFYEFCTLYLSGYRMGILCNLSDTCHELHEFALRFFSGISKKKCIFAFLNKARFYMVERKLDLAVYEKKMKDETGY